MYSDDDDDDDDLYFDDDNDYDSFVCDPAFSDDDDCYDNAMADAQPQVVRKALSHMDANELKDVCNELDACLFLDAMNESLQCNSKFLLQNFVSSLPASARSARRSDFQTPLSSPTTNHRGWSEMQEETDLRL